MKNIFAGLRLLTVASVCLSMLFSLSAMDAASMTCGKALTEICPLANPTMGQLMRLAQACPGMFADACDKVERTMGIDDARTKVFFVTPEGVAVAVEQLDPYVYNWVLSNIDVAGVQDGVVATGSSWNYARFEELVKSSGLFEFIQTSHGLLRQELVGQHPFLVAVVVVAGVVIVCLVAHANVKFFTALRRRYLSHQALRLALAATEQEATGQEELEHDRSLPHH